ncbi:MAG: long-chain fatty acid--CoA ligase [Hyphomicrobiales bacterium]|nr:long-chain fatty acid--CoA ligase [Hyphomicrobiales bacterium]
MQETTAEAQRPWLAHYPPGVPQSIDETSRDTIVDLFRNSATFFRDRPAAESFGVRVTYGALHKHAEEIAIGLQQLGLVKGDRVAIMMPNVMAYPALIFGTLMAGCVVVNVNPLYTARELTHQLNDSGARVLFVLENFAHTVEEAMPELLTEMAVIVSPGDLLGAKGVVVNFVSRWIKRNVPGFNLPATVRFPAFLRFARHWKLQRVEITADNPAFLQYTGGTTGLAKGAVLLHRNIVANVAQCEAWLRAGAGERPDHVMITALPLYHILALTACCLFVIKIGGCQVLIVNPRDLPTFIKTIKSVRMTMIVVVNTLANALASRTDLKDVDFSQLSFCISGGMATQAAVARKWKDATGHPIIEGYGLSETSPVVSVNRLDITEFTGSIGYPMPSTDVSIRAPDGSVLPIGTSGELCVKGPQVMSGYWQQPEETQRAFTADGYFRTGDIGIIDPDGSLRIVDRIKDMIIVSGFNVYPNEVEDVLASHPKVAEAAVVGIPDAYSGEAVSAYVVPRTPDLTVEELRLWCRENLTGYKVPRRFEFRETLPKTNVGKILRRELREHPPEKTGA